MNTEILNKINDLLALRESKEDNLRQLNLAIKQGLRKVETFPTRWYVENPSRDVLDYLSKKYNKVIVLQHGCGYGELHGEYAFVPCDVSYSWEITQEEFDYILTLIK